MMMSSEAAGVPPARLASAAAACLVWLAADAAAARAGHLLLHVLGFAFPLSIAAVQVTACAVLCRCRQLYVGAPAQSRADIIRARAAAPPSPPSCAVPGLIPRQLRERGHARAPCT